MFNVIIHLAQGNQIDGLLLSPFRFVFVFDAAEAKISPTQVSQVESRRKARETERKILKCNEEICNAIRHLLILFIFSSFFPFLLIVEKHSIEIKIMEMLDFQWIVLFRLNSLFVSPSLWFWEYSFVVFFLIETKIKALETQ